MSDPEAAIESAFYDHEQDEQRRETESAPDWGADEVFATVPRRRFERKSRAHTSLQTLPPRPAPAPRTRGEHPATAPAPARAPAPAPAPALTHTPEPERAPNGRRTVVVTGRPAGEPRAAMRRRERPGRSLDVRLGPRPDRVAAWAFAMGMLLILIAVGTADAAAL